MNQHSWLYSDSFLKRAFAVWGHYFVANLIIGGCIALLFLFLVMAFGLNVAMNLPDGVDQNDIEIDYQPVLPD